VTFVMQCGEKDYVSTVCGKALTGQVGLKRHMRLHTGGKFSTVTG
jgi:hypothetical protein